MLCWAWVLVLGWTGLGWACWEWVVVVCAWERGCSQQGGQDGDVMIWMMRNLDGAEGATNNRQEEEKQAWV